MDALDPLPEQTVDSEHDAQDPDTYKRLHARVQELQSQNDQLLKERDSAVGIVQRLIGRLRDTLNLGGIEGQAHDRLVAAYTDKEAEKPGPTPGT